MIKLHYIFHNSQKYLISFQPASISETWKEKNTSWRFMAAYAALTSLKHIIHQLQNYPFPPISLHKQQVESLTQIVTILQGFLEGRNYHVGHSEEADPLEMRIADVAYKAEDVIETKIVDQIHIQSTIRGKMISFFKFFRSLCKCTAPREGLYRELQLVIEDMDLIKNEAMTMNTAVQPQLQKNVSKAPRSSSSSTVHNSITVGFDDVLIEVMDKLTGGEHQRQIILIMGMGGIGKTTLARNIFENALIKEYFDICAWTTISQSYNAREILREVLSQARGYSSTSDVGENELGEKLYKYLSGRRYLVIMDDMWSTEAWDNVKFFFPESNNGSRIIVTTRLSNLASHLEKSHAFNLKFLDEVSSWDLFSKTVFQVESIPPELEKIGKRIVRNCRGLPLSIVAIGGLLGKSELTPEYWEHIEGNLNSIVNSKDDEYCLKILKMSYNHLPVQLKPCFLYMGVFEEDRGIRVSTLIKLWVSEGFLKPISSGTSLETIAEGYLKELVDRNLVLVHKLGSTGNIKYCKIHDLFRDLCLREGERERFYHVIRPHSTLESIYRLRRIVIPRGTSEEKVVEALGYISHARSVICDCYEEDQMLLSSRLLRTFKAYDRDTNARNKFLLEYVLKSVNLRYIAIGALGTSAFPSSINLLWNLHTLIILDHETLTAPVEIWNMPHLRHAKFDCGVFLPDPPTGKVVVMKNLQTLKIVMNLKLNKKVVKRIPNIKKLFVSYTKIESNGDVYCVNNLECLHKLESFQCFSMDGGGHDFLKKLTFPQSLKKLNLVFPNDLNWEAMLEKIGPLLHLEKLQVTGGFFATGKWETVEGEFLKLKKLLVRGCEGLEQWTTESSHFPCLEEIRVDSLKELKEIPLEMGDIPTLQSIVVERCSMSVVVSASAILEKREELQVEEELGFHVRVVPWMRSKYSLKLVCCSESRTRCAELKIAEEQEREGKYYNFRSQVLNEDGNEVREELQGEQPHFHYRDVLDDEGDALQRFAGPNFTVV